MEQERFERNSTDLTARELEVAKLLAREFSNGQIAFELCLSPETIKSHVAHVLSKLGVKSRHQVHEALRARGEKSPDG